MGPMMGGPWMASWLVLLAVVVVLVALALVTLSRTDRAARPPTPAPTPEEVLRTRYARGELTRDQYREVLVDVLKDRYVRGELDLGVYEAHLARLLEEPRGPAPQAAANAEPRPSVQSGDRPTAPGVG